MQHLTRLMMTLTLTTTAIPRVNIFTLNHNQPQIETIDVNYIQLPATAIYYASTAIALVSIFLFILSIRQYIKRIIKWQTHMHMDPATHTEILLEFTTHTHTDYCITHSYDSNPLFLSDIGKFFSNFIQFNTKLLYSLY